MLEVGEKACTGLWPLLRPGLGVRSSCYLGDHHEVVGIRQAGAPHPYPLELVARVSTV